MAATTLEERVAQVEKGATLLLGLTGLLGAVLVLVVCAVTPAIEMQARGLFSLALLFLSIDGMILLSRGKKKQGAAAAIIVLALIALSFGPWFAPHWSLTRSGGALHRHNIWELGHTH